MSRLEVKLKKMWLKLLRASCKKNWDKARKLHAKIIGLELEIRKSEGKNKQPTETSGTREGHGPIQS
jgi:hypothetical protein